jgi:hypothetical protein
VRKNILAVVILAVSSALFAQQGLNNDAVIKLVKAGLSDDLILSTVGAQPGSYDTSTDGIIALKTAGVSDKVISAIVAKASAPAAVPPPAPMAAAAPPAASSLPPGIDEVGVYYKDKSGAWQALMPEIVNFKTGGVMKSIMTDGIVKGDLNGHIEGPHARTSTTFPVVFAVYVPEGTAITEYQLLRLRPNNKSREFRSVTGGVMHVSGGATRDTVEYHPEKIMSRVYQITLDTAAGKGEYGLLPPGATGSSNLGSSGKIYSISVAE